LFSIRLPKKFVREKSARAQSGFFATVLNVVSLGVKVCKLNQKKTGFKREKTGFLAGKKSFRIGNLFRGVSQLEANVH
jgi:hypothetical protein